MTGVGGQGVEFDSPSGNIHCGIYVDPLKWGCSITEYSYVDPEPTGDLIACSEMISYGHGFWSRDGGPVTVMCRGGAEFGGEMGAVGVLPYGTSLAYNGVMCESADTGMTCRDVMTGAGFVVARNAYTLY
ncbi:MAG: hypothetical protein WA006_04045 [Rhodoglobus sp.]